MTPRARAARVGLVMSGGGARGAYQAGVLKAIAQIGRELAGGHDNPFPVIVGTSAGAINAAALATRADEFEMAVGRLVDLWSDIGVEQVYRADAVGVIRSGARWLCMLAAGWAMARWHHAKPRSFLDNGPLMRLLSDELQLGRVPELMRAGHLQALAIAASSYTSGHHVTFYDAIGEFRPWTRSQRLAVPGPITVQHVLASSALPFVFPAAPLLLDGRVEWFGDGSMRQSAPISPAIHLGAERVLVVGAGRMLEPRDERPVATDYPSPAQIAGHALSSIFLDALAVDIERLQRINRTLALLPEHARERHELKVVEVLVIAPSQRLDDIAARHLDGLPSPVRAMLRVAGVRNSHGQEVSGTALASYLLFARSYTRELIALGLSDTLARRDDVARFLGWKDEAADEERLDPAARSVA